MKIYNSMTRKKEEFKSIYKGKEKYSNAYNGIGDSNYWWLTW